VAADVEQRYIVFGIDRGIVAGEKCCVAGGGGCIGFFCVFLLVSCSCKLRMAARHRPSGRVDAGTETQCRILLKCALQLCMQLEITPALASDSACQRRASVCISALSDARPRNMPSRTAPISGGQASV